MQTPVQKLINLLENQGFNFSRFKRDLEALKKEEKDYIQKVIIDAYNAGYEDKEVSHINDCDTYANQIIYNL